MKKILLLVMAFLALGVNVYAAEGNIMWYDAADNAYTTDYSGIIKPSDKKSYKKGAITSHGNAKITFNNLKIYAIIVTDPWTLELKGVNELNTIEEADKSTITITGDGVLKVKSIGLSMTEMVGAKDADWEKIVKKYVKGNYSLSVSGNDIVIKGKDVTTKKTTTTTTKKTTVTTKNTNSSSSTTTSTSVASKTIEPSSSSAKITENTSTNNKNKIEEKAKKDIPLLAIVGGMSALLVAGVIFYKLKNK